jgi:hypothetical protein
VVWCAAMWCGAILCGSHTPSNPGRNHFGGAAGSGGCSGKESVLPRGRAWARGVAGGPETAANHGQ